MRKANNQEHLEGRVYQHTLEVKVVNNPTSQNNGKEFIAGVLDIAVDEEGLNVIPVHFTYVTEMTNSGKKNATYGVLKRIIDENKLWTTVGKDEAFKVKVDTALGLNDFPAQDGTMISVKQNEGGFVSIVNELCDINERNTFNVDMLITSAKRTEKDEEKHIDNDFVTIRGAIFNFRNALLPLDFVVKNTEGMKYFEDLCASDAEPIYTRVWGRIECLTKTTTVQEETAFGEAAVRTYERKTKEWVVTGTAKVPYDFGDENILTKDELKQAMQDRATYLADIKKRAEDYRASKETASTSTTSKASSTAVKAADFSF